MQGTKTQVREEVRGPRLRDADESAALTRPAESTRSDIEANNEDTALGSPSTPFAIFNRPKRGVLGRYATAALVVASVAAGALMQNYVSKIQWTKHPPVAAPLSTAQRIAGPITLNGPGGPVTLPMATPVIVNIWLEGCADCMPAFEAYKTMQERGALSVDIPVVNVAYGSSRTEWARTYGVDDRLVYDDGKALVRPLGVSTFTTLIIDADGWIRIKDRPDNPGYVDRLIGAVRALQSGAKKPSAP